MNTMRKGFTSIIVILLLVLLAAGGAAYYQFSKNKTSEQTNAQKQKAAANNPPASDTNDNCAKDGESPNDFDLTKGKIIPGGKSCCPGLMPINGKRVADEKTGNHFCLNTTGVPGICRPCGNGVCDPNEDTCNCPQDCK